MTARTGSSTRRGRGDQGTFHCAGPHRSLPSAPRTAEPKPEPEPEPEPSQLRAAAPVAACVSPLPEVGDNMLSPPPTLSHQQKIVVSRPSLVHLLLLLESQSLSPQAPSEQGREGEGRGGKKSQERENCACARAVAGLRPEITAPPTSIRKSLPGTCLLCGLAAQVFV